MYRREILLNTRRVRCGILYGTVQKRGCTHYARTYTPPLQHDDDINNNINNNNNNNRYNIIYRVYNRRRRWYYRTGTCYSGRPVRRRRVVRARGRGRGTGTPDEKRLTWAARVVSAVHRRADVTLSSSSRDINVPRVPCPPVPPDKKTTFCIISFCYYLFLFYMYKCTYIFFFSPFVHAS